MVDIALRSAVVAFMVVSLSAMFTSTQHSEVHIIGFSIPVSLRWNRSQPFEFLVVVELLICAYAFVQFVYQSVVLAKNAVPTRRCIWVQLAADQVCAYLVLAAAAAAAGASRTNKSGFQSLGMQNIKVPGVCIVLDKFCNRATIAIIFTLLAAGASGISVTLDVYMLTLTYYMG
uniref:CASP-like protein 3A1 n=1 Tax=Pteridium aquilinum subsp. aquilinum TaxID=104588 RepID=CSPL5_PTEAA|nr:RecName: Full=CASP-like protein 3A1; Short=PaCASPL3A1 [Pteridium aquilinum subsp. aquilinum]